MTNKIESVEYLTRENSQRPPQNSQNPYEEDCKGCKKDYPFADILPKDETYIDYVKNKELIGMVVQDVGMKCSNIMGFIHNLKNYYPIDLLDENVNSLKNSVTALEQNLLNLKDHLQSRETLARSVLNSDGSWIQRSK